jgi:hypothetical protein
MRPGLCNTKLTVRHSMAAEMGHCERAQGVGTLMQHRCLELLNTLGMKLFLYSVSSHLHSAYQREVVLTLLIKEKWSS